MKSHSREIAEGKAALSSSIRTSLSASVACRRRTEVALVLSILSTGCVEVERFPISTNPPGAMVYVDGSPIGRSPTEYTFHHDMSIRQSVIRAELQGYSAAHKQVGDVWGFGDRIGHVHLVLERQTGENGLRQTESNDRSKQMSASTFASHCDLQSLSTSSRFDQSSVAVMDFDADAYGQAAGRALADLTRFVVSESGRYLLLDRENIVNVLGQEDFARAVRCNKTKCLVNYGRILQAQKLCHGRVNKVGESLVFTLTMTDVSSAKVDAFKSIRIKGSIDDLMDVIQHLSCELIRDALVAGP